MTNQQCGPQTEYVDALIQVARQLRPNQVRDLAAVWDVGLDSVRDRAARDAWEVARVFGRSRTLALARSGAGLAVLYAPFIGSVAVEWEAAGQVARDAATGLVVRDGLSSEQYDALTRPWRTVIGPIHPDDEEVK